MTSRDHRLCDIKEDTTHGFKQKKEDSLFEMYKNLYTHTHTHPHTLSIAKVNGSIHTNILKATQKFSKRNKTEEFAGLVCQSCPEQDFIIKVCVPSWTLCSSSQSPGEVWGAAKGGAMNVLIRTGSLLRTHRGTCIFF